MACFSRSRGHGKPWPYHHTTKPLPRQSESGPDISDPLFALFGWNRVDQAFLFFLKKMVWMPSQARNRARMMSRAPRMA